MTMHHIDADTTDRLLDYAGLVEALRAAHRDGAMPETEMIARRDRRNEDNKFVTQFAWASGEFIAVKLVGVFPSNTSMVPPQASVQGIVVLIDGRTGQALMTADGAALTFHKTAADSALGADILSRRDARTLLVAGSGGLAPHVIDAHMGVRPSIERVIIWNRSPEKAAALAKQLAHVQAEVSATADLDGAIPQADIVSSVTMATEPLIKGALLKPGAHVDLIGAYLPEMREADDDVIRRAGRLFVDTRVGCEGSGDVGEPLARGIIDENGIVADLFDLCGGRHAGRGSDTEITVYKNVGGGHLDLFAACHLLSRFEATMGRQHIGALE